MASDVEAVGLLRSSAWSGGHVEGNFDGHALNWAGKNMPAPRVESLASKQDPDNWKDPTVGWGVVLPDNDAVPASDKAIGADAPEPIRTLIAARGKASGRPSGRAPIFRYRADLNDRMLRLYKADGSHIRVTPGANVGDASLPKFLLIVGSPAEIPWEFQYNLHGEYYVGRLDLDIQGLERYVEALLGEWSGAVRNVKKPVIWSVDHGHPDITRLMRKVVAEKLQAVFAADSEFDMAQGFLTEDQATQTALAKALSERNPAMVMTTSHGATYPLQDPNAMAGNLGLLMDRDHKESDLTGMTDGWNPRGAIWYAHACCSAGCDSTSRFEGLVDANSTLGQTLTAIGKAGARTAPLPKALLGGKHPLGAFIGHVEPTFDWTLRHPVNGQATAQHIFNSLYHGLHSSSRTTVGRSMHTYYNAVSGLLKQYLKEISKVNLFVQGAQERAARAKLLALDLDSMVILGDPTVRLPLPT